MSRHPIVKTLHEEADYTDDDYGSFSQSPYGTPNSYQSSSFSTYFENFIPQDLREKDYVEEEEYSPLSSPSGGKDHQYDDVFQFEENIPGEQRTPEKPKATNKPSKDNDIKKFDFSTPSPDDQVLDKQKKAFQQKADTTATNTTKSTPIIKQAPVVVVPPPVTTNTLAQDVSNLSLQSSPNPKRTFPKQMAVSKKNDILEKLKLQKDTVKESLNLVVIGHVDAGKSTLMGHLLYQLGQVDSKIIHKYEKESKQIGKQSFSYAWVLDEYDEERQRGVTMDVGMNFFETDKKRLTLLDAPGHRDFVPNMITGTAQADVAILVLSASTGEFESGFQPEGQTREHSLLAKALGVSQLIVAINKLDTVNWAQARYEAIKEQIGSFLLKNAGFMPSDLSFVPCSGLSGENLKSRSSPSLTSWYNGTTLVEQINLFKSPARVVEKPLRLCISDVYKSVASGLTVAGKIEVGVISTNDNLLVVPLNEVCVVKSLRVNEQTVPFAIAGDNVDISVGNIDISALGIGQFLCDPEAPIKTSSRFQATIITFSSLNYPLTLGAQVDLHYQTINEAAVISKLISVVDKTKGKGGKRNNPRCIMESSQAEVEITVSRPICIEVFTDCKQLGRFSLRETGRTIAAGVVTRLF